jgi:hypothetical protein
MRLERALSLVCCFVFVLSSPFFAQKTPPDRALGAVTKEDIGARLITVRTDTGAEVIVTAQPTASFRRVAPGETDLQKAAIIALADISMGDRVLARGRAGANGNGLAANLIVVMSKGDIAQKEAADRADWDRRGVMGVVMMAGADQILINVRTASSVSPLVIKLAPNASVRRYAPGSVRFADARPSALSEIQAGDQVRARGNRTADGSALNAEEVVSGTFRTIAGVVVSLDPQQNEVRINDLDSKKPLVVKVNAGSSLHRLQPDVAQAIAARVRGGAERSGDLQQMIESSPSITLADLKASDPIVVSGAVGANAQEVTAITLLTGVESILRRPGTKEMSLGSWTLDIGIGEF